MTLFLTFCASHSSRAKRFFEVFLSDSAGSRRVFRAVPGQVLGWDKNILKKFCEHKNPGIMRQNGVFSTPSEGNLGRFRDFRLAHPRGHPYSSTCCRDGLKKSEARNMRL